MEKFDHINLEQGELIISHQNNVQRFQLFQDGIYIESRYFGDIYITNLKILFIDRNLRTEFSMPLNSINQIVYKRRYFSTNSIEIIASGSKDKIAWKLIFDEDGASKFKNELKKLPIHDKVSVQSPLISEIKEFSFDRGN
uniref:GRAM domain-containing protein n=1 Tax=Acrobeloides nanus TaxID=290746 RepID=A0A914E963_9BILA